MRLLDWLRWKWWDWRYRDVDEDDGMMCTHDEAWRVSGGPPES